MAILAFQKPDKVVMLEANDKFGCAAFSYHRSRDMLLTPYA